MKKSPPLSFSSHQARSFDNPQSRARSWRFEAFCAGRSVHLRNYGIAQMPSEVRIRTQCCHQAYQLVRRDRDTALSTCAHTPLPRLHLEPLSYPTCTPARTHTDATLPCVDLADMSSQPISMAWPTPRSSSNRPKVYFGCIAEIACVASGWIFLPLTHPIITPTRALRASERRGHPGIMSDGPKPPLAACDAPGAPWHLLLTTAEVALDACAQAFQRLW